MMFPFINPHTFLWLSKVSFPPSFQFGDIIFANGIFKDPNRPCVYTRNAMERRNIFSVVMFQFGKTTSWK